MDKEFTKDDIISFRELSRYEAIVDGIHPNISFKARELTREVYDALIRDDYIGYELTLKDGRKEWIPDYQAERINLI